MVHKITRVVLSSFVFGLILSSLFVSGCKRPGIGYNQGYEPDQPIPYDHSLHAGKYAINCQFCHANVDRAAKASVPSLNICMNCHINVKVRQDLPEESKERLKTITQRWREGKPVEWVKVHMLPDFVKFNHHRHVNVGKSCQECHGPVETMPVVRQHTDLSMGWCVECHRKPENNASLNCTTCHH